MYSRLSNLKKRWGFAHGFDPEHPGTVPLRGEEAEL